MDKSIGNDKTLGPDGKSGGHTYALNPGDLFGQYRVTRVLGAGGMGEVYEVEHTTLDRRYALKLLPSTLDWQGVSIERFRREAKVMANLDHPNILKVDDFGETDGRYWLRMEVAEGLRDEGGNLKGVSLQDLADAYGGKIPQDELLPILRQVLEGLQYAHSHGAIHRDLKPSNILLSSPDTRHPTPQAKISDFGLVRLVGEDWVRSQAQLSVQRSMSIGDQRTAGGTPAPASEGTSTRALLGTYEYMSPEQKRGEEADERSDLYAVGLMAYRLLTGRNLGMKTPTQIDGSLLPGWDAFVAEALEENRDERLASASSALILLNTVAAHGGRGKTPAPAWPATEEPMTRPSSTPAPTSPPIAPPSSKASPKSRGGKGWLWLLLIVAGVVGYFMFTGTKEDPEPQTRDPAPAPVSPPTVAPERARPPPPAPRPSTRIPDLKSPWENSLGMKFNPVPGTDVLFGVWETRVQDFRRFVEDRANNNGYNYRSGEQPYILKSDGWKQRGWDFGWHNPGFAQGDTHPVTCVSYEDAVAFCAWLTRVERAAGVIGPNQAYRLPRDWEWSVAVGLDEPPTGTPQSKDEKIQNVYPWNRGRGTWPPTGRAGNYAGEEAKNSDWPSNFGVISGYRDGHARTSPVGAYDVNAHGLYDLGGNVWEWCEDFYAGSSGTRVLRGGSWGNLESSYLLSSCRVGIHPGNRDDGCGFRVVLSGSAP